MSRFYFEINILQSPDSPVVGIGLSKEHVHPDDFVGWKEDSWGYHGDDGNFHTAGHHEPYGPYYGAGDVVGCGYDRQSQSIFFTVNGEKQRDVATAVCGQLYPTVSIQRLVADTHVVINFGPYFQFDTAELDLSSASVSQDDAEL